MAWAGAWQLLCPCILNALDVETKEQTSTRNAAEPHEIFTSAFSVGWFWRTPVCFQQSQECFILGNHFLSCFSCLISRCWKSSKQASRHNAWHLFSQKFCGRNPQVKTELPFLTCVPKDTTAQNTTRRHAPGTSFAVKNRQDMSSQHNKKAFVESICQNVKASTAHLCVTEQWFQNRQFSL